jgi:hypothetical protein
MNKAKYCRPCESESVHEKKKKVEWRRGRRARKNVLFERENDDKLVFGIL